MKKTLLSLAAVTLVAGCATPSSYDMNTPLRTEAQRKAVEREAVTQVTAPQSRVVESDRAYIPVMARKVSEHAWLRQMRVTVQTGRDPVPMSEVLRALARQGISITSEMPLDRFQYSGFSLNDVDAESALRAIVASVGLDYQADASRKLVVIKPMSSRTWYLNIGNRRSNFSAGGNTAGNPSTSNTIAELLLKQAGAESKSNSSQSGGAASAATTSVSSQDDFWTSLKSELDARLKLMLPDPTKTTTQAAAGAPAMTPQLAGMLPPLVPPANGQPGQTASAPPQVAGQAAVAGAQGAAGQQANNLLQMPAQVAAPQSSDGILSYSSRQVGTYAVNPETGAVTVQAPHWVLQDLDLYFARVQSMYNTDISFQGELIMLTTDSKRSEGLDISSFAKFANNKYGLAYANNGLGGVTVSFPNGGSLIPSLTAGGGLPGPLLGVQSLVDGLQVFNAYLTNMGRVSTLQKPVLTTTSGVPADFRRTVTKYFNTVSQQAASSGTGSAAVGTQNTLIPQDFGTVLRVNPRIDVATGLIRAQIELVQTTQTGTQSVPQTVTSGNSVSQVPTQLPVVSRIVYSGEALLRDGDLVVMGGQTEDLEDTARQGVTGLMDSQAVGGVFGNSLRTTSRNVFYFALRVTVNKR